MMYRLMILLALTIALIPVTRADFELIELYQRQDVMAQQQRLVGNLRAVARREGVVLNVPQLYVFHYDFSEAYHMEGYRSGFERELNLIVERRRGARSMVRLDRLLERVETADGESIEPDDLPAADVYVALYRRAECDECEQVADVLRDWIQQHPEREVVWLDVQTDRRRD